MHQQDSSVNINIQTISFVGSAGSESFFSLSRYADGVSIEEISEKIYNAEKSVLIDVADVVHGIYEDHGSTANCRNYETFKVESMDLEAEIAQIQEQYYAAQDRLNNMEIVSEDCLTTYIEDGNVCKIVVAKDTGGIDYAREYSFDDDRLYFAYVYDEGSEHRFYFVDDMLVRYMHEQSEIYNLDDADSYMQFASKYQNDEHQKRGNASTD